MKSLKQKTVSGVKWEVINKVLQKVVTVCAFAILARILEPSAFGLFALAFVAIDGLQLVKSFGLDAALIQRKEKVDEAAQTAFFIILASGVVIFAVCELSAPLIAAFFKNSEVASVIRALGVILLFNSISKIPSTLLAKAMRYKDIAVIGLWASVINAVCAVLFALLSPTVWCLVWAYIIKQCFVTTLSWRLSGFRLRWYFSKDLAKNLFGYGKFMIGLSFLWYISANLDNIVIGKMLGTAMLGYYALAFNIGNFINTHFTQLVSGVMFPAYSSIQNDQEALRRVYLKTVKFITMLSIPFSLAIIFLAPELVYTVYGEKWAPVVPLMRLFGVIQLIVPVKTCSGPVFMGRGRPDYSFNLTLSFLLVKIPLLFFFTKMWGLQGAVTSELIMVLLFAPINLSLAKKLVHFKFIQLFQQLSASLISGLAMIGSIIALKALLVIFWPVSAHYYLIRLVLMGGSGAAVYFGTFYLLDKSSTLEARQLLFNWKPTAV